MGVDDPHDLALSFDAFRAQKRPQNTARRCCFNRKQTRFTRIHAARSSNQSFHGSARVDCVDAASGELLTSACLQPHERVQQAILANFPTATADSSQEEEEAVVVLLQNEHALRVFPAKGHVVQVTLPFPPKRVFALRVGILIEADHAGSDKSDHLHLPVLFTLAKPLEEIKPVALLQSPRTPPTRKNRMPSGLNRMEIDCGMTQQTSEAQDRNLIQMTYFTSAKERIVALSDDMDLLLTFHWGNKCFQAYQVTKLIHSNVTTSHLATDPPPLSSFVPQTVLQQSHYDLYPEFSLTQIWNSATLEWLSQSDSAACATLYAQDDQRVTCFVACSTNMSPLLCVMDRNANQLLLQRMQLLVRSSQQQTINSEEEQEQEQERQSLRPVQVDPKSNLKNLACRDALPLYCKSRLPTKPMAPVFMNDLVVLSCDGSIISLYREDLLLCIIQIPHVSAPIEPSYVRLSVSAKGSFVLAAASPTDGTINKQFRCWHPLVFEPSAFVEKVFDVLEYVLPIQIALRLRLFVVQHALVCASDALPSSCSQDVAWQALGEILSRTFDPELDQQHQETPDIEMNDGSDDAFAEMLKSEFHGDFKTMNSHLFNQLRTSTMAKKVAKPSFCFSRDNSKIPAVHETLKPFRMIIFGALHLLHQDLLLSASSWRSAKRLAGLLLLWSEQLGLRMLTLYYRQCAVDLCTSNNERAAPDSLVKSDRYTECESSRIRQIFGGIFHDRVPDVLDWIYRRVEAMRVDGNGTMVQTVPSLPTLEDLVVSDDANHVRGWAPTPLWRLETVCKLVVLLTSIAANAVTPGNDHSSAVQVVKFLTSEEHGKRLDLSDLPVGISILILNAIHAYRDDPPRSAQREQCVLVRREDLVGNSGSASNSSFLSRDGAASTHENDVNADSSSSIENEIDQDYDCDGLDSLLRKSQRLFPQDQRVKEVSRLLRSCKPLCLKLEKTSDVSDQEFIQQQQARLLLLCKRSMALSIARGMVTLANLDIDTSQQHHAWKLKIPKLPLAGRTPPTNAIVALDVSGYAKELTHWPQFHNGCAAALRLPAAQAESAELVTRYWIRFHRPSLDRSSRSSGGGDPGSNGSSSQQHDSQLDESFASHAGLLLGLGLSGHLKCLSMADVYNYLSLSNELVTIAILLGMAATAATHRRHFKHERFQSMPSTSRQPDVSNSTSQQQSQPAMEEDRLQELFEKNSKAAPLTGLGLELDLERSVSKMLCLHIPSLLPPPVAEFSVPASTQTAALLGLGLLYQGTGHRLMTELLLNEITRSPSSSQFLDTQNMNGSTGNASFDQMESYSLAAGLALGLVTLGRGSSTHGDLGLADLKLEEKLYKYIVGGAQQMSDTNSTGSCLYRARQWSGIGVGGSSTRSSSATGRMGYSFASSSGSRMGCERNWKGEHVNVGVTACGSALALAFMYMKTENKSIAKQLEVPDTLVLLDFVRPDLLMIRALAKNLVLWSEIEADPSWIETKEIPAQLANAYVALRNNSNNPSSLHQRFSGGDEQTAASSWNFDALTICEAYANIVAGACLSMGLRFAGTSHAKATETLAKYVKMFREMRSKCSSSLNAVGGTNLANQYPDRVTVERCLAVCAQSLALVNAGSGNLTVLRLLRSITLRQRVDGELTYGNHMALSMALGLLFLGGGKATINRSHESIAALVIALYPMFPMNTADNKHHLQAFRHLYVLSADFSRLIETIDVQTKISCPLPIQLQLRDSPTWLSYRTPCLIPELDTVRVIVIQDPNCFPLKISLDEYRTSELDGFKRDCANGLQVKLLREFNKILIKTRISRASHLSSPLGHAEDRIDNKQWTRRWPYNLLCSYVCEDFDLESKQPLARISCSPNDVKGWWLRFGKSFAERCLGADVNEEMVWTGLELVHVVHQVVFDQLQDPFGLQGFAIVLEFLRQRPKSSSNGEDSLLGHLFEQDFIESMTQQLCGSLHNRLVTNISSMSSTSSATRNSCMQLLDNLFDPHTEVMSFHLLVLLKLLGAPADWSMLACEWQSMRQSGVISQPNDNSNSTLLSHVAAATANSATHQLFWLRLCQVLS